MSTIPLTGLDHFFIDEPNGSAVDGPGWMFCRFQNDQFTYQVSNSGCAALIAAPEIFAGLPFSVTPNPFHDDFRVAPPLGEKISSLRLFDISGKVVLQISDPAETKIHAGDLPPGVYFLEVVSGKQNRLFQKLVKH